MSTLPRVFLRDVLDLDLSIFFEHQRDPEASRMAEFPARDHEAFMAHWAKIRRDPTNLIKTIVCEGEVAGNIGSWMDGEKRLIGYWLGRKFWDRGIATAALQEFVGQLKTRPLHVFVVKHHSASIRVLEKCGFVRSDPSVAGDDGVEELLFELPGSMSTAPDRDPAEALRMLYAAFNVRDPDTALAGMTADVEWPRAFKGGFVHGPAAVAAYWREQWAEISPQVEPLAFHREEDGQIVVTVHQIVRDLAGTVLAEDRVGHRFTLREGLVERMEVCPLPATAPDGHHRAPPR